MYKFGLIASDTARSEIYIKNLIKKYTPLFIIIYAKKIKKLTKIFNNKNYQIIHYKTNDINDRKIERFILNSKINNFIFSGYSGEIIKSKILLKNIIHAHPGDLPRYKGSTTIYYSILMEKKIFCTVFKMSKKIDEGKILFKKRFSIPKNKYLIENNYDAKIRARTLFAFLKKKNLRGKLIRKTKKFKFLNANNTRYYYYIAHPIVRQIVINKNIFKNINF
jgi:methionyl-tRNA formyltransferase